jgi:tRNA(Ile)-lysidine synthase
MDEHAAATATARVRGAVGRALRDRDRVVLAVSGGRDSMVLLDVMANCFADQVECVATFDHGTGSAAREAAALVARRARELGFAVRLGHASHVPGAGPAAARREADWREARWSFLNEVSRTAGAAVATAHTRDDQIETVFMRSLRDSGARGLAGLYSRSLVLRPLLELSRGDVAEYASARRVIWVEDPSNQSRSHLRNRVRLDLLPALELARPGLSRELLELSRRAALLRREVDEQLARRVRARVCSGALEVARADLQGYDGAGLGLLWPALAARVGAVLDRRGTERITEFTIKGRAGARIQLSGGWEVVLHRGLVVLRLARVYDDLEGSLPLKGESRYGGWLFRPLPELRGRSSAARGKWSAALPVDAALSVRPWRPGDRMTPLGAEAPRRVKGLFRDAGIDAVRRRGWPVVLVGDEIVWIPGVRVGATSTFLSDRPVVVYECERYDD